MVSVPVKSFSPSLSFLHSMCNNFYLLSSCLVVSAKSDAHPQQGDIVRDWEYWILNRPLSGSERCCYYMDVLNVPHHTTLSLAGHCAHPPLKVYLSQNEWEKIAAFASLSSLFIILFLLAAMHFVFFSAHFSLQCCMVCFGSTFLGNVKPSLILYMYKR